MRSSHHEEHEIASSNRKKSWNASDMDKFVKRWKIENDNVRKSHEITISFEISHNQFKDAVWQIRTVDSLPFNTFEKSEMKELVKPITDQIKKKNKNNATVSLHSQKVRQKLSWKVQAQKTHDWRIEWEVALLEIWLGIMDGIFH